MASKDDLKVSSGTRLVLVFAGIGIVFLSMRAMAGIINSISLALILAISTSPLIRWLTRRGLRRSVSTVIVIVVVVLSILVLNLVFVVSLQNVSDKLPEYQAKFDTLVEDVNSLVADLGVSNTNLSEIDAFSAGNIVNTGLSVLSALINAMSSLFFMLILAVYMLVESLDFPAKLEKTLKAGSAMPRQVLKLSNDIRAYITLTVWVGALSSALMTVLMFALGVDFALLWGLLAFIMSFIPYVGFVLALVPPALFALLESGFATSLIVIAGFIIINTLTDYVLKPRIMGKGLELSPLVVMLALFVWAWVLGPIGAILAIPMTIIVKVLFLEPGEDTRWIANLMMPVEAIEAPAQQASD